MKPLFEQHRPTSFDQVVGQDRAIGQIATIRKRGLAGKAFWITGKSGTGKTTIARLIAREVADPFNIQEFDAGELNAERLREIERTSCMYGMGEKTGRAFICNEAHGISGRIIRALDVLLEPVQAHCVWIFTTTCEGQENLIEGLGAGEVAAFMSRPIIIELSQQGLAKPFAERVRQIAQSEGLDGQPIETYVKLLQKHKNNMRAALQEVESGGMLA